ncbi:MAG: hypothetical protein ABR530_02945 [Pyrinomonadaceae bacterium]
MPDNESDNPADEPSESKTRITGLAQQIIGELEVVGGVLTGDPITQAEGEFNVEVGTVREGIEDDLEESGDLSDR